MLTKRKRKFIFWITIVAFFILAIVVLFYSLGYRIGSKWQIQKTGGIFIQANQSGATVTMDGKKQKNTSLLSQNALIKNVGPGNHEIRVTKNMFYEWYKMFNVSPEIVTAYDVLLIPNKLSVQNIATTTYELTPAYYLSKHTIYQKDIPKPRPVFVGVEKFWQLPQSNTLLVLGEDKTFYINNKKVDESTTTKETLLGLESDVAQILISLLRTKSNLIFDDSQNRVIYWDDHTIGSYWIGELDKMPQWQKTRSILILTLPAKIRNIIAYPDHGDYLLMEMGGEIWALEMDSVNGQNFVPIYQGDNPKFLGKNTNTIFIQDNKQNFSIELP
ncbi:MAG: PEGA domain-containing protein [Patescibacteria group bacterium]